MNYFANLFGAIIGQPIDALTYNKEEHKLFADKQRYEANQADLNFPFEEAYAKTSDVYSITNKIARNAKTIPWKLFIQTGDNIEEVNSGELYDLIQQPNPGQSRSDFVEEALLNYLLSGNMYLHPLKTADFSTPLEVFLLHPQLMKIKSQYLGIFNTVKNYEYHANGKFHPIDREAITHLKYCNPTIFGIKTLYGLSPLTAGYLTTIGLSKNQEANASIIDNQAVASIISNEGDYILNPEEQDEQQRRFNMKYFGSKKYGKVIQSNSKVKIHKLGLDPTQLRIIESKTMKMRDLCNIYDVNSVLFNDPQNRVQANLVEANTSFWTNAVIPNTQAVVDTYQRGVVSDFNKFEFPDGRSKYFIELDTTGIAPLQKDQEKEARKDKVVVDGVKAILDMRISFESKKAMLKELYDLPESVLNVLSEPANQNN